MIPPASEPAWFAITDLGQAPATMAMSWAEAWVELSPCRQNAHLGHCSSDALH